MLKKYVVELDEENVTSAMGYDWLRMPISVEGKEVDIETTIQLLPYIAPNLEQIKREAYREGREDGVHDGMCDAWEAAKKIALMDTETSENVTGYFGLFRIMENLTPMQAIEKLKAYEQGQEEIKVGDIVRLKDNPELKIWVTNTSDENGVLFGLELKEVGANKRKFERTGEHHEVGTILDKIRKE